MKGFADKWMWVCLHFYMLLQKIYPPFCDELTIRLMESTGIHLTYFRSYYLRLFVSFSAYDMENAGSLDEWRKGANKNYFIIDRNREELPNNINQLQKKNQPNEINMYMWKKSWLRTKQNGRQLGEHGTEMGRTVAEWEENQWIKEMTGHYFRPLYST